MDIGEHYDTEYSSEVDTYIYRNSTTGRKLKGKILLRDRGYIDTSLIFKSYATFSKGIQIGTDSVFRNDTLIEINNYSAGRKHGEQVRIYDSSIMISHYQNGVIHGEELILNHDDVVIQRSKFRLGVKQGTEYEYNNQGNAERTVKYELDSNEWQIPYRRMKSVKIKDYNDSLISIYDYVQRNRAKFMGVINIFPSENTWIWPDEVIHPSEVNSPCSDCIFNGRYYIIVLWEGDNLDQIWTTEWIAYTSLFESNYEFIELKSP